MTNFTVRRNLLAAAVSVVVVLGIMMSFPTTPAAAKPKIVAVEGVNFNVSASMGDNLKSLYGKRVYVTLNSGKSFTGLVKKAGEHLVHIEKLVGKEYFDALIRIEDISAIDTMFRKLQR